MSRFIAATLASVGADPSIPGAVACAAMRHGVPAADIVAQGRGNMQITVARQDAYRIASDHGHAFAAIGRFFHKDHTTIMHGVKAAQSRFQLISSNPNQRNMP